MIRAISILLLFPFCVMAQVEMPFAITLKVESSVVRLDSGWRFKVGDDLNWAKPDLDDSSWQPITLFGGLNLENVPQIPKESSIIWFRIRLFADTTLISPLLIRIFQTGAHQKYTWMEKSFTSWGLLTQTLT